MVEQEKLYVDQKSPAWPFIFLIKGLKVAYLRDFITSKFIIFNAVLLEKYQTTKENAHKTQNFGEGIYQIKVLCTKNEA